MFNRTFIILQLLLAVFITNGQTTVQDNCGIDKSPLLNKCEAKFLDSLFATMESQKQEFNFLNRKAAFFDGNEQISKERYFTLMKNISGPRGIDILNEKQKKETGYDVIAVINLKIYQKDYFVNKLKIERSN